MKEKIKYLVEDELDLWKYELPLLRDELIDNIKKIFTSTRMLVNLMFILLIVSIIKLLIDFTKWVILGINYNSNIMVIILLFIILILMYRNYRKKSGNYIEHRRKLFELKQKTKEFENKSLDKNNDKF